MIVLSLKSRTFIVMNSKIPNARLFRSPDLADLVEELNGGPIPSNTRVSFAAVRSNSYGERAGELPPVGLNVSTAAKEEKANGSTRSEFSMEGLPATSEPSNTRVVSADQLTIGNQRNRSQKED